MTTNHKENLDPALLRPGRADYHCHLNNASHHQMTSLFNHIFPGQEEKAVKFANQLPEFKLSMAKVQGHFLKYRFNTDVLVEKAKDLMKETVSKEQMNIPEWLSRLNLSKYEKILTKFRFYNVSDLRRLNKDNFKFEEMKITSRHAKQRMLEMIGEDKLAVKDFEFKTMQQTRMLLEKKIDSEQVEELLQEFGCEDNDVFTGFQLKDVINKYDTIEEIRGALQQFVIAGKKVDENLEKSSSDTRASDEKIEDSDDEEEKEDPVPTPS